MAATGFTPIKLYASSTASAVPLAANLDNTNGAELAINTNDGKLFYKDSAGNVQTMASKATGAIGGSTTQVQFNNAGVLGGSASLTWSGTVLTSSGFSGPLNGTVGATTPAAGSFTTVGASGAVTLSGGTANGVTYLNGSKVLTSGSALTFDGTNLTLANTAGVASNLTTNQAAGTIGSPLNLDLNFKGYINSTVARIRSWDESGSTGFGYLTFWTNDGTTLAERYRITQNGTAIWNVAGTEQMRLTSTGLGIGTSSPSQKLQVAGNVAISDGGWFGFGDVNERIVGNNAGFMQFFTDGSERMRLDSSGNLGLGVTPSAWGGSSRSVMQFPGSNAIQGSNSLGLAFFNNAYNNGTNDIYSANGAAYKHVIGTAFQWFTSAAGTAGNAITFTQAMTLDASGNLGIGTSSPRGKIDVVGRSYFQPAAGTAAITLLNTSGGDGSIMVSGTSTTMNYGFNTYSTNNALYIQNDGNVGIGTSSIAAVTGFSSSRVVEQIGGSGGYGQLRLGNDAGLMIDHDNSGTTTSTIRNLYGATNASALVQIQSGYITFGTGTSYTERARIDSSGNLLVGTTSQPVATYRQVVNYSGGSSQGGIMFNDVDSGAIYEACYFRKDGAQRGYIRVTTSGTTYATVSDYRLKTESVPMTGALSKVLALNPCTYKWKETGKDGQGFIAHELQAVVPDCVTGEKDAVDADGNPHYQGIDTSFLVATLTAAIQEQQALIQDLTTRLAALEAK